MIRPPAVTLGEVTRRGYGAAPAFLARWWLPFFGSAACVSSSGPLYNRKNGIGQGHNPHGLLNPSSGLMLHVAAGYTAACTWSRFGSGPPLEPPTPGPPFPSIAARRPAGGRLSIERIAVLGAGIMGRGIAYAAAVTGFDVRLYDTVGPAL